MYAPEQCIKTQEDAYSVLNITKQHYFDASNSACIVTLKMNEDDPIIAPLLKSIKPALQRFQVPLLREASRIYCVHVYAS